MKLDLRYASVFSILGAGMLLAVACGGDTQNTLGGTPDSGSSAGGDSANGAGAGNGMGGGATGAGATAPEPPEPDFVPDVDNDTEVDELDDDELQELCDEIRDYANEFAQSEELQEFQCRANGITVALFLSGGGLDGGAPDGGIPTDIDIDAFREACQESYDQCIEAEIPAQPGFGDECQRPDASCDVTVGEVEECLDDVARIQHQLDGVFPSCEDATVAKVLTAFLLLENASFESPACEAIDRCDPDNAGAGGAGN
jgi:hypothetical protein